MATHQVAGLGSQVRAASQTLAGEEAGLNPQGQGPGALNRVFPTVLPASKAAGIAAIRISRASGDVLLEELNAQQKTIIGFRLHALVDSARNITAIAITQIGDGPNPLPLTPAQRSALGLITDELKQFKASNNAAQSAPTSRPGTQERSVTSSLKALFTSVDVGIACGFAGVEGGLNPIADAGCLAAAGAAAMDEMDETDDTTNLSDPTPGPATMQTAVNSIIQRATDSVSDFQGASGGSDSSRSPSQDEDGVDTTEKDR